MSTERDELAKVINKALGDVTGIYDTSESEDKELASVMLAAGYRKCDAVIDADAVEAAAEAMYEDFRTSYMDRYNYTPEWSSLGTPQKDEWRRHSRVAARVMANATGGAE